MTAARFRKVTGLDLELERYGGSWVAYTHEEGTRLEARASKKSTAIYLLAERVLRLRGVRLSSEYGYRCAYCGRTGPLQIHHVTPRSKGGGHQVENLVPLCPSCHEAEHLRRRGC